MPLSPLLARLKQETSDLHLEAERYVRILDDDATLDDYRRYLVAMHGYHAPLEAAFARDAALARAGFDARARIKSQMIADDLAALGSQVRPTACAALPDLGSHARTIGAAYVIEGSTLGGRFVLAKLPPSLAALRGTATRFLEGYGADTGARWRAFALIASTADVAHDDVIAGARDTFARLIDWLACFEERLAVAS